MTPDNEPSANPALVRAEVLVLLREKRYEEALALLYRARSHAPNSLELQRSIEQVKEFLIGAYAKRLGGLDQIAQPIPAHASRSPDVVLLSRFIDGNTTFGDVAQMSPLGQLRTLQVLVGVYPKRGSLPGIDPAVVSLSSLPRVDSDLALPRSGLRAPQSDSAPVDTPPPDTARSAAALPLPAEAAAVRSSRSPASIVPVSIVPVSLTPASLTPISSAPVSSAPVSSAPVSTPRVETDAQRQYRESFERGTAAFIQRRYADAVEAFEHCGRLRPGDAAASVMLRRSLRDLESQ